MNFDIIFKNSDCIKNADTNEILRYMGCRESRADLLALALNSKELLFEVIRPKAVWRYAPILFPDENTVDFGFVKLKSEGLKKHLENCRYAVFMAATIGNEADFIIKKHSVIAMSEALAVNAAGAAYIESYCDYICDIIGKQAKEEGYSISSRFSPGYSDLPLECQTEIFSYLKTEKNVGIHLTDTFMMIPSKSVCAIVGVGNKEKECDNKCLMCNKSECEFRKGTV